MSDGLLTWRKSSRLRPLWGDFPPTFQVATKTLKDIPEKNILKVGAYTLFQRKQHEIETGKK